MHNLIILVMSGMALFAAVEVVRSHAKHLPAKWKRHLPKWLLASDSEGGRAWKERHESDSQ